jgi:hypothetical protein
VAEQEPEIGIVDVHHDPEHDRRTVRKRHGIRITAVIDRLDGVVHPGIEGVSVGRSQHRDEARSQRPGDRRQYVSDAS